MKFQKKVIIFPIQSHSFTNETDVEDVEDVELSIYEINNQLVLLSNDNVEFEVKNFPIFTKEYWKIPN